MDLLDYIDGYGNGYGDGYGDGNSAGCGNGCGEGYGSGYDDGYDDDNGYGGGYRNGNGYGNGNANGNGYGDGDGIVEFENVKGYKIDGMMTYLQVIRGNVAKGFTLERNVKKIPCWVYLTEDGFVAHSETLHKSREAAFEKSMVSKTFELRCQAFIDSHPDIDAEYDDLFLWHHILTGSCEYGRKQWCDAHGLKPTDSISVRRFIDETKGYYGGKAIEMLERLYFAT